MTFVIIAIVFFALGLGGNMYIGHQFAVAVDGREYVVKGRKVETDDPFVRKQFRKYYAIRVVYSVFLLVMLVVVANNVG